MSTQENNTLITTPSNEITVLAPTRPYDSLSAEEQQKVKNLLGKLEDYSSDSIIDFSADAVTNSAREAKDFLKNTKLNDLQDFQEAMQSLIKDLRSINPKDLSKQEPSALARIPLIGKFLADSSVGKKVERIISRQQTVAKSISFTVQTISGIKLVLREDLIKCKKTRADTIQYAKDLELLYHALYQKRLELEETYNKFINSSKYDPNNLDHTEYAASLQDGMQRLERKMRDIKGYHSNATSDIPSFQFISKAEESMIDEINDCITNLVPEWEKAFQKAIIAYRVANAAEVVSSTKKATNDIILASANITSQAIISAAEAVETPQIASETLEKKTQIFLDMCDKLVNIALEASQRRIEESKAITEDEQRLIAANSQRSTVSLISDKSGGNSNEQ